MIELSFSVVLDTIVNWRSSEFVASFFSEDFDSSLILSESGRGNEKFTFPSLALADSKNISSSK